MIRPMQNLSVAPSAPAKARTQNVATASPDQVTLGARAGVDYSRTLLAGLCGSTPLVGALSNSAGTLAAVVDQRPAWVGATTALGVVANLAGTASLVAWALTGNPALAQFGAASLAASGVASGIGSVEMSQPKAPRPFF